LVYHVVMVEIQENKRPRRSGAKGGAYEAVTESIKNCYCF